MHSYARLSLFGILAIVLLRFGVGYHFYMEGASKVRGGDFRSEGFLKAAEGPLASQFHNMIWDYNGAIRLDQAGMKKRFTDAAAGAMAHFKLTKDQEKKLEQVKSTFLDLLSDTFASGSEDIEKYRINSERLAARENQKAWYQVASLNGQLRKIEKESRAAVADTMAEVDALWTQYERKLNTVPTRDQFVAAGAYRIERPGEGPLTTSLVDKIIPIFDMSVGILLMIGLLTPVASFAAFLFLLSVVLSQFPGAPGAAPTYFQAVECLALLTLMATDAGRYAGLDFIPWAWWNRKPARVAITPAPESPRARAA